MKNISTILKVTAFIAAIILLIVYGPRVKPGAASRYDAGYDDGYTETYNTLCKKIAVTVEGDWDDKNYYRGYTEGQLSGASKCRSEQVSELARQQR